MPDASLHLNLSDVVENLQAKDGLSSVQKRDLISGVNTLSKWLEIPLDKLPADRRSIRASLEELNPSQLGVSKKRYANVRSLIDQALDMGMVGHVRQSALPLTSGWNTLLEGVSDEWRRFKLVQLARYCSAQDIAPEAVSARTFADWLAWRTDNASLAKKPERAVQDARTAWNWCAQHIEGWAGARVAVPSQRKSVLLPLEGFPPSLKTELEAFEAKSMGGPSQGNLGTGRKTYRKSRAQKGNLGPKPVSARVVENRVTAIRMCASELVRSGEFEAGDLGSIADIVCADHAGLMVDGVITRTGRVTEYPHSLVKSLRAVAVQWLNADQAEISAFNDLLNALGKDAGLGSLTATNRARLAQFANAQNIVRLVSLPEQVFAALETERQKRGKVSVLMACKARTAIAVSTLTMLPVRRANLCGIEVGKHLVLGGTAQDQARLAFEAHEVKNNTAIGCVIPIETEKLLRLYLKYYRPKLHSGDDGMGPLLVTQAGVAITGSAISNDLRNLVRTETGLTVNVHLFRHIMGAIILRAKPGQFDTVRALLGHSKDSRVTALYAEIESSIAAEVLDEAISKEAARRRRKPVKRQWSRRDV